MNKKYISLLFVFVFCTAAFAQKPQVLNKTEIAVSSPIESFNAKRNASTEEAFVVFKIKVLKDAQVEKQLVELLDKLDEKIVNLKSDLTASTLRVGYANSIQLLDIMQVLYGQGFHATFIAPDGMTGMLNSNNEIEYWYTKN